MKRIIGLTAAALLLAVFGIAGADEKAMKEHQEMGTQGVTPHMTKEKQKALAKRQREQDMQEHQDMGTQGVTPHARKKHSDMSDKQSMKEHENMGKEGVWPEGKKQ